MLRPAPNRSAIWSKSAPNLDKTRSTVLTRPNHDIGNTTTASSCSSTKQNDSNCSNKSSNSSLQLLINRALTSPLSELKRGLSGSTIRNNSFPINNASGLGRNNRLSRSIGNIAESHYDTVFSTNSFVIARGVSNSVQHFDLNDNHDDTEQLLK